MKTLRMTITVSLEEIKPGSDHPLDTVTIASGSSRRIVDDHLRVTASNQMLKYILFREATSGAQLIARQMLEHSVPWPLNETIEDKEKKVQDALKAKFPNLCFRGQFRLNSGGRYSIFQISLREESHAECAIPHPLNPKQILTTRFSGTFCKLVDGRWVNCYQGMQYYDGVVEEVPTPFSEAEIAEVFSNLSIPFIIEPQSLEALPPIEIQVPEEDE